MTSGDSKKYSGGPPPSMIENVLEASARLSVITLSSVLAVSLSAPVALAQAGVGAPPHTLINKAALIPFTGSEILEEEEQIPNQENLPIYPVDNGSGVSNSGFIFNFVRHCSHGFFGSFKHMCRPANGVSKQSIGGLGKTSGEALTHQSQSHLSGCYGWSARAHGAGSHS